MSFCVEDNYHICHVGIDFDECVESPSNTN